MISGLLAGDAGQQDARGDREPPRWRPRSPRTSPRTPTSSMSTAGGWWYVTGEPSRVEVTIGDRGRVPAGEGQGVHLPAAAVVVGVAGCGLGHVGLRATEFVDDIPWVFRRAGAGQVRWGADSAVEHPVDVEGGPAHSCGRGRRDAQCRGHGDTGRTDDQRGPDSGKGSSVLPSRGRRPVRGPRPQQTPAATVASLTKL